MYKEKISAAKKVSKSDPGECKKVDPKASEIISRNGGLGLNDFICYDENLIQKEYLCTSTPTSTPTPTSTSSQSLKDAGVICTFLIFGITLLGVFN